jgi:hypothetical protein
VYEGSRGVNRVYEDSNLDSDTYNFKRLDQSGTCQSEIWLDGNPPSNSGDIIIILRDPVDGNCQLRYPGDGPNRMAEPGDTVMCEGPDGRPLWDRHGFTDNEDPPDGCDGSDDTIDAAGITLSQPNLGRVNFRFINEDTIEKVDGSQRLSRVTGETFTEGGTCGDSVILTGSEQIGGQTVRTGTYRERSGDGACNVDHSQNAYVTSEADPGGDDDADGDGAVDVEPSCESEGGEMSWLLCPALRAADKILGWVETETKNLFEFPNEFLQPPAVDGLKRAWARIRNIGYMILLPIMLVMVMSTALGFEFVSAYTLKRALPRMVLAAVFMATSFELMRALLVFVNNISVGLEGLITSAVTGSADISLAGMFDPDPASGFLFTLGVAGGVVASAFLIPLLLGYAGAALIAVFMGFLALALRRGMLVGLMLLAPVAILSWIFPGNDKLWKLWWGTFSKLLFLYPIYAIILGSAKAFAALLGGLP